MATLEQAQAMTQALCRELAERSLHVEKRECYHRGAQPLAYASEEWRKFHGDRYRDFSDNWCGVVGSSPAERTAVFGFRLGDDSDVLSDDERALWDDWKRSDMEAQQSQGFLHSAVTSRSFVIVWGGQDDEPVVSWERSDQVAIAYDAENRRVRRAAVKAWVEAGVEFATLYLPGEVWKFQRSASLLTAGTISGAQWTPRRGVETNPSPNPLGVVPVVEFPNRPVLGGRPISEIEGVIAMQDAVNLMWAYLFGAADFASMNARVILGQDPPKVPKLDANGVQIGEEMVPLDKIRAGRILYLTDPNAKIAEWQSARLDTFTDVIHVGARHIAAQTRTPIHYIASGDINNVNGETLTALEAPLVAKVVESQLYYGPAVREVFRLMALVRGNSAIAESCRLGTVQWKDAETRTLAQAADAAVKDKSIGLPLAFILERRFGLSQTEIRRVLDMRDAEAQDAQLGAALSAITASVPAPAAASAGVTPNAGA